MLVKSLGYCIDEYSNGSWSNLDVGLVSLIPIALFRNIGVVLPVLPRLVRYIDFPLFSLINTCIN